MEAVYDRTGGQADEPHRHDYYTVLLTRKAKGKHFIDFNEFDLGDKQVWFIAPGQVHQIIEEQKSYGRVLTFSPNFLLENGIERRFIEELHLFNEYGSAPPLELSPEEMQTLESLAEQMSDFFRSNRKFRYQAVGALLKLFFIRCNNFCSLSQEENTQTVQASVVLLRNFKRILDERFREWHKVSEYAAALHITSDYLNASVKSLTGKSAKEHIQSRITVAAKRMLKFSTVPTKEIAYELGFSAPANFSQFFKKCVGISPTEFRN